MASLIIKPAVPGNYHLVALGEVMLRLDPGEGRVRTARQFNLWEGGGEYNVARGLRRCFGLKTAVCTAFADNEIGRLLEDLILQGGVATDWILWRPYDGVGREVRNGLNFTERGFGIRGAVGVPDRGHSAASQLKPGDFDWDKIFESSGARWFHTGGIFAALSDSAAKLALEAIQAARRHGVVVSYDLNYRPSLWRSVGGLLRAQEVNRELAAHFDVVFGNEEDFTNCLGLEVKGFDPNSPKIHADGFRNMMTALIKDFPNIKVAATTLRSVKSASRNDWGALCWAGGQFYEAPLREDLEVLDRVGGGDSFASGFIFGMLSSGDPQQAVEYGAAHGALVMTTPGDTSMASLAEVQSLVRGGSARIQR
jgi:2-dehydro-3-deoxygluconokinase